MLFLIFGNVFLTGCDRPIQGAQTSTATDSEEGSDSTVINNTDSRKAPAENAHVLFQQALKLSQDQHWSEADAVINQALAIEKTPEAEALSLRVAYRKDGFPDPSKGIEGLVAFLTEHEITMQKLKSVAEENPKSADVFEVLADTTTDYAMGWNACSEVFAQKGDRKTAAQYAKKNKKWIGVSHRAYQTCVKLDDTRAKTQAKVAAIFGSKLGIGHSRVTEHLIRASELDPTQLPAAHLLVMAMWQTDLLDNSKQKSRIEAAFNAHDGEEARSVLQKARNSTRTIQHENFRVLERVESQEIRIKLDRISRTLHILNAALQKK